MEIYKN